jgi:hypothetical protein
MNQPIKTDEAPGELVYDKYGWKIFRQDAGMGEKEYCVMRHGGFFGMFPSEQNAVLVVELVEVYGK